MDTFRSTREKDRLGIGVAAYGFCFVWGFVTLLRQDLPVETRLASNLQCLQCCLFHPLSAGNFHVFYLFTYLFMGEKTKANMLNSEDNFG